MATADAPRPSLRSRITIRTLAILSGFVTWCASAGMLQGQMDANQVVAWLGMVLLATYAAIPLFSMRRR